MVSKDATALRRAVEALDRHDRMLVLLRFADELTPLEIAAVLRRPESEIRSRLQSICSGLQTVLSGAAAEVVAA